MTREQFVNDAATTLNGALTDVATSVTVTSGAVFPAVGDFHVLVNSEIMLVTARATNVLTVVRGQEGTTAAAHSDTDAIKVILTAGAITTFADDAIGVGYSRFGGYSNRKPFRLLNFAGTTLTSSDFSWQDQVSSSVSDDPAGGMTVTIAETSGNWKLLTKAMPTPPFALTAHLVFGAGHSVMTTSGQIQGIGFRDSTSGRYVVNAVTLGDECAFWRYTNTATFSATATNQSQIQWRSDEIWMKIVDDNTNIYSFVSPDGIRWFETGSEVRTAWLAAADEICWAFRPSGTANNYVTLNSWVEHVDDIPLGFEYEAKPLELLTDVGTATNYSSTVGKNPAGCLVFHAHGEGVAAGTARANSWVSIGMSDFTTDHCMCAMTEDAQTTGNSQGLKDQIRTAQYTSFPSSSPEARAELSISGGDMRVFWNSHNTTGETQGIFAMIGGSRHQTKLLGNGTSHSVGVAKSITGVGFAPDVAICMTGSGSYNTFNQSAHHRAGIGFAVRGGSQASVANWSADNVTTTSVSARTSSNFAMYMNNSTDSREEEITAWEADGIEVTAREGTYGSSTSYFFMKLPTLLDAGVITLDWPGTTGEQTFSFGFKPRLVIMASVLNTAIDTTVSFDAALSISVIDSLNQACASSIQADNVATSECQSMFDNKALSIPTTVGGTLWEADFVEFTDDGMTLDFTTVDVATKAIAIGFR